jgi:hypothetical protein
MCFDKQEVCHTIKRSNSHRAAFQVCTDCGIAQTAYHAANLWGLNADSWQLIGPHVLRLKENLTFTFVDLPPMSRDLLHPAINGHNNTMTGIFSCQVMATLLFSEDLRQSQGATTGFSDTLLVLCHT